MRAYVVKGKVLEWQPAADVALRQLKQKQPQAPVLPANFAELTPEQKQNFLLANAMYLQARLLSSGLTINPQDTKAIAQLAQVAQGIVRTSVELEQLKADHDKMGDLAVKLLRTFTAQTEALQRYRGKGQQKVTVEHVHVHGPNLERLHC